jgi:predicted XRE-type DNA-binding protein
MSRKRNPTGRTWLTLVSRFNKGIRELDSGCWVCDGAELLSSGYTRLTINQKPFGRYRISTHRLSYQINRGSIPASLCVCHSCDNPACCNPEHLFLGTHADNARDRETKRRGQYGEEHPNAKLTDDEVRDIHRKAASGLRQSEIAEKYGLTQAAVSAIVTGKLWAHLYSGPARQTRMTVKRQKRMCSVNGCRNQCRTHGMCIAHYRRLASTGTTDAAAVPDAGKSLREILVEKFARGIEKLSSGCWTCAASDYGHESGYGRVGIERSGRGAVRAFTHRLSYEHFRGPIPSGQVICHSCDNRRCCNPSHLFLGTQAENLRDMVQKGRSRTGERHHNARLSEDQVNEIRRRAGSLSQRAMAAMYGISQGQISDIICGKRWKHLPHTA